MRAGTARVDITPTGSVWMDGMIRAHPSTGVHDALWARALVMSGDQELDRACAIVSVDVCSLTERDASAVRERVEKEIGIPAARIVISATHTHSGPATVGYFNQAESEYVNRLVGMLVEAIGQAAGHMVPVAAGCGSGKEDTISHYRRLLADDGHVVMNWEPYDPAHIVGPLGEVDPEVGVLKLVDEQGQVVCLLFNHAGHPNVLSGDNYLLSAEYPGLAERLLEASFGGTALFVNGAQGTMDIDGLRDRDWVGMERIGRALAGAVAGVARGIEPSWDMSLRCDHVRYALPARQITDREWSWAAGVLEQTGGQVQALADGVGDDYKALLFKRLREAKQGSIPVEQICIALGDTAFLSFPGELFTEIGAAIKARSSFTHTYILGLANGAAGYVPTRQAVQEGGYAVDTRRVDEGAEQVVLTRSLDLLRAVHRS